MMSSLSITQALLFEAKAYLCWNANKDLSIQLVPDDKIPAYFIPKNNTMNSIILFYKGDGTDIAGSFFLLFHEAGHLQQFNENPETFQNMMNCDNGANKQHFEKQAWQNGRELLHQFLQAQQLHATDILDKYDHFADQALRSYRD